MIYNFLTSYKFFDCSYKTESGLFVYCKFNSCKILKEFNLLEFTCNGEISPLCKLDLELDNISSLFKRQVHKNMDVIYLKYKDIPNITLYGHK